MGIDGAAKVVFDVLNEGRRLSVESQVRAGKNSGSQAPMKRDYQFRVAAFLLGLTTLSAVIFAAINFNREKKTLVPEDGISWLEQYPASASETVLVAQRVDAGGPGDRAGIKPRDRLETISHSPLCHNADRM